MKNKLTAWCFFSFSLITTFSFGQKNAFVANADRKLFSAARLDGWVKFQAYTSYSEKTIFTEAKVQFGLTGQYDMQLVKSHADEYGMGHYKFKERYNGIEILGAEYIIHTKNGLLQSGNGNIFTPKNIVTGKAIPETAALQKITGTLNSKDLYWNIAGKADKLKAQDAKASYYPKASLVYILSADENTMILCYSFFISTNQQGKHGYYYVNAQNGKVEKFISATYNCDQTTVNTSFYGVKPLWTNDVGAFANHSFDLEDDCQGSVYSVYDRSNNTDDIFNTGPLNDLWGSTDKLRSAATCLYSIKTAFRWFNSFFGRNGHDNDDGNLNIYYGHNFGTGSSPNDDNASYNYEAVGGDEIRVGLGKTASILDDWNALDILTHEFTHGITHAEAGLVYRGEPGALNESFSDIFGEWVENKELGQNDWLEGNDRMENGLHSPIRSFINPTLPLFKQPDRIFGINWQPADCANPDGSLNDFCGVHFNSGVQNHMFYLLSVGASGWTNDVTSNATGNVGSNPYQWSVGAIGIDNAIRIAYRVLCDYLWSTSNYNDSRNAWVHAAADIFGECSNEAIQTGKAWDAVGIHPPTGVYATIPVCGDYGAGAASVTHINPLNVANNCIVNITTSGNPVNFESASLVHIYPGFKALEGSSFKAAINDCTYAAY